MERVHGEAAQICRPRPSRSSILRWLREKAGDCPDANSTAEINICYTEPGNDHRTELEELRRNHPASDGSRMPQLPGKPDAQQVCQEGQEGRPSRPNSTSSKFDQWSRSGGNTATRPAQPPFTSSTGAPVDPASRWNVELKLARDHMHELDLIYGGDLHL
jgi:hypothetical protein